jgi:hypothetical protein
MSEARRERCLTFIFLNSLEPFLPCRPRSGRSLAALLRLVLYLGAASGTSVSHVADIVGPTGLVYAVEFSHRSGRDLINMAKKRTNVIPIIEDARYEVEARTFE